MQLTRLLLRNEQKSYATNNMMIDELDFKARVTHVGEISHTFESYIPAPKCELKAFKLS